MSSKGKWTFILVVALLLFPIISGCSGTDNGQGDGASGPSAPLRLKVGDKRIVADPASGAGAAGGDQPSPDQQLVLAVWNLVEQEFYDSDAVDHRRMAHAAIRAMLESLSDEETTFTDATGSQIAEEDRLGSFDGIGVTVEMKAKRLTVVAPIDGSPASKAGMRAGDVIVQINGRDASDLGLVEAVSQIRGPRGTSVRLGIEREGEPARLDLQIVRGEINVIPVKSSTPEAGVAYLKISQFSQPAAALVYDNLTELLAKKPKALIIDMRNNPGGLLQSAVLVASQFVGDGVVLYEQRRDAPEFAIDAVQGGLATNLPLVVLVNKGTASAAEVVAGALQDRKRGLLVGERTFGKQSVQSVHPLPDGSTISITVAKWLSPNKRDIAGKGLTPDVEVALSDADVKAGRDPQLERALQIARTTR